MRDTLPTSGARKYESGIVNLDSENGLGTHWVAYKKMADVSFIYDPMGNLTPLPELVYYLNKNCNRCGIFCNHDRHQFTLYNCGDLCLKFLYNVISENI